MLGEVTYEWESVKDEWNLDDAPDVIIIGDSKTRRVRNDSEP